MNTGLDTAPWARDPLRRSFCLRSNSGHDHIRNQRLCQQVLLTIVNNKSPGPAS